MAALDFGMALARGMLPTLQAAQEDLINLAGGRGVFKSEDWWNKAVDKQIKSGYRQQEDVTFYKTTSGDWKAADNYSLTNPIGVVKREDLRPPKDVLIKGYTSGGGNILTGYWGPAPIYETKPGKVFLTDAKTSDFNAGQLKDIELGAKRGAEQLKRTMAESKASRKKRGTGGLMGKARAAGEGPTTGLPALGEAGLIGGATSVGSSILGSGIL